MKSKQIYTFFVLLSFAFVSLLFQNCSNQGFSSNLSLNLGNPTNTPNSNSETCTNSNSCITQTPSDVPIKAITDSGWSQVPDSKFSDICRSTQSFFGFTQDCRSIFTAWNSAIADTNKNRLVIFGGGHNDYYGNEVYSFDLMQRKFIRLNDPTPLAAKTTCMTTFPDGRPSSRHSYGGLSFIPDKNKMILFGGSPSCPTGGLASDAWLLDLTSLDRNNPNENPWVQIATTLPQLPYGGILAATDYDTQSKLTYLFTSTSALYSYNADTNQFNLIKYYSTFGYHYTGVIDPQSRLFLLVGGGYIHQINIDTGEYTNLSGQFVGCENLISSLYPGLAYYPEQNKIVGWAGGSNIYVLDLKTRQCSSKIIPGVAPAHQLLNGTNGRFRYFPAYKAFVLANDPDQNVYLLKIDSNLM